MTWKNRFPFIKVWYAKLQVPIKCCKAAWIEKQKTAIHFKKNLNFVHGPTFFFFFSGRSMATRASTKRRLDKSNQVERQGYIRRAYRTSVRQSETCRGYGGGKQCRREEAMSDQLKGFNSYRHVLASAVVGMFFPYRHVEIIGSRRRHACRHNARFKVQWNTHRKTWKTKVSRVIYAFIISLP